MPEQCCARSADGLHLDDADVDARAAVDLRGDAGELHPHQVALFQNGARGAVEREPPLVVGDQAVAGAGAAAGTGAGAGATLSPQPATNVVAARQASRAAVRNMVVLLATAPTAAACARSGRKWCPGRTVSPGTTRSPING
ncbi:hypothetical protein Cci01nite_47450 [Catellatospora citrea]|uniref:Uncharacterized protein n=1 Tax=Catellatospora citrea TaxID=53366 RepID=A0A8J3KAH7_9ACTN|nr:hypothetical protein Cci01nite_47450 [Catellatospora citrea]